MYWVAPHAHSRAHLTPPVAPADPAAPNPYLNPATVLPLLRVLPQIRVVLFCVAPAAAAARQSCAGTRRVMTRWQRRVLRAT
ncbi:unnamed protein product, partial [Iphiclides podalirius]